MSYSFHDYWITESLRLRESLWGPLEDSAEAGKARSQQTGFTDRAIHRATLLARREGLDVVVERWQQVARLLLWGFMLAAVIAGSLAASAALGSGSRPVNLALAVTGLLGLNALTLLLWVLSFGMQGGATGTLLADTWLNLTRRLARGPDAALAPRALLELLTRHGLTRWSAGTMSHAWWSLALISGLITLMVLLSVRSYTFQWETTLLSPDTYVALVRGLGWLPSLVGFPQPEPDVIRASGGSLALSPDAHALWSGWLLGVVVVYGLVPRISALVVSATIVSRRRSLIALDPSLPGIAELHDRLMPQRELTGIDSPEPDHLIEGVFSTRSVIEGGQHGILGVELPHELTWPPEPLHPDIVDLGVIDTRDQRQRVLHALRGNPAGRLLVVCDAHQTPDRGTIALLAELASLVQTLHVTLVPDDNVEARRPQWREQLLRAGLSPEQLHRHSSTAMHWLNGAQA